MEENRSSKTMYNHLTRLIKHQEFIVFLVLLGLVIFLSVVRPTTFPTPANLLNVFRTASQYIVLATGMAFVILSGNIDLSVGAIIACSCSLAVYINSLFEDGIPAIFVLLIMFAVGILYGIVNGLLVSKIGLPAFITTLGTLNIGNGISLMITRGSNIRYGTSWISVFGGGMIGNFPVSILVMVVVVLLASLFCKYTKTGRNIYAVGNSPRAATLSGINADKIIVLAYAINGAMSALVGLMMVGQLRQAGPSYGNGYEMDAIASAVIGGFSTYGGEGNMWGVVLGATLIALLRNLFVQLSVSGYWQTIILGAVIIGSVSIDCVGKKRAAH